MKLQIRKVTGTEESEIKKKRLASEIRIKVHVWLGGMAVKALHLRSTDNKYDSRPPRFGAATLTKSLTHMCLCHHAVYFGIRVSWEGVALAAQTSDISKTKLLKPRPRPKQHEFRLHMNFACTKKESAVHDGGTTLCVCE